MEEQNKLKSELKLLEMHDPADYKTWEFVDAEVRALTRRIYQLTEDILQQQGDDDNDYGPGDRFELGDWAEHISYNTWHTRNNVV